MSVQDSPATAEDADHRNLRFAAAEHTSGSGHTDDTLPAANPVTPGLSPMWRRLLPVAAGSFTALTTLGVMWWNPGDDGVPLCPSKFIFGVDCPFCGATRATAAMARGDFVRALDHNALWIVLVPMVVAAFGVWTVTSLTDRPMPRINVPRWVLITTGVALVAFGVARNLDVSPLTRWLAADSAAI